MFKLHLLLIICVLASPAFAQVDWQKANEVLQQHLHKVQLSDADIADVKLLSSHRSKASGLNHFYIQQQYQGLPVGEAIINLHLTDDGQLHHIGSSAVVALNKRIQPAKTHLPAQEALERIFTLMDYEVSSEMSKEVIQKNGQEVQQFTVPTLATDPIDLKLMYTPDEQGNLVLTWDAQLNKKGSTDHWQVRINAATGELLSKHNHTLYCQFKHNHFGSSPQVASESTALPPAAFSPLQGGTYRVYPLGVESPIHGESQLVSNVADPIASPFDWHDIDGIPGADFNFTIGNNVVAQEDFDGDGGNGLVAGGGEDLNFDFSVDFSKQPIDYAAASITNLFYWNNVMHDIFYHYGFDEAAGNFQFNNYGRGGLQEDLIFADAQDGAINNNASFFAPVDGIAGIMNMHLYEPPSFFSVHHPDFLQGAYEHRFASSVEGVISVSGDIMKIADILGNSNICEPILADLTGKFALVDRGDCSFRTKAKNAQDAGAIGVIVCNNEPVLPSGITLGEDADEITIPLILLQREACDLLLIPSRIEIGIQRSGLFTDSSLDNSIISHEYGHGISIRLTGGADVNSCLDNFEQMGEGWSDWFSLMVTMQETDTRFDDRGHAVYANGQAKNGPGNRAYKYSTDLNVNPQTYNSIGDNGIFNGVHYTGVVWAEMLWEMTWNLIDKYGFDSDLYYGKGGNNQALALVTEGLKLQPCFPGFVDGRDAILAADQALYGGANQCEIWCAFAKRGLGATADQGSPFSVLDGTESYEIPDDLAGCNCNNLTALPLELTHFTGAALAEDNLLQWVTSSEINIREYWIERSVDGQNDWQKMGQQPAQNKRNTAANYELLDTKPLLAAYYRLASVATSGTVKYASTIFIDRTANTITTEWEVYPNPASTEVQMNIQSPRAQPVVIRLHNALGQLVVQKTTTLAAGQNNLPLSLETLSDGMYWLSMETNGQLLKRRIVKTK